MDSWILTIIIFLPLLGVAALMVSPAAGHQRIRHLAMLFSGATFVVSVVALLLFLQSTPDGYAFEASVAWLGATSGPDSAVDIRYHVGVDGISIWLLVLTTFLTPLAIWASFTSIREQVREYYALMLVLECGMLGVFCAVDLLLFYVCFEFTLVPLFFIIGIWGGPERRRAAGMFFIYTMAGSMLMFAGVLYLAWRASQQPEIGAFTFAFDDLYKLALAGNVSDPLTVREQWWLFLALFAGFAIKVPLFPVHTWLPLAHTEAPTAGSVILAGVLLKLGTYGLLRINLPMLPDATIMLAPFMATLAIVGIVYGALIAWVQEDIKKLVAYSSVSHLGFCVLGMFSLTEAGLRGSLLYMINHGLSTAALFLVVGCIYERYHTRSIHRIGGLAQRMPVMAFFLIFFTLSSIGLPGLNGFVSEFLVLLGTFTSAEQAGTSADQPGPLGWSYAAFAALGIILSAVYMLWMCQRVLFGPVVEPDGTPDRTTGLSVDLTPREVGILTPLAVLCLVLGLFPNLVLSTMGPALDREILARVMATGGAPAVLGADAISAGEASANGNLVQADHAIRLHDRSFMFVYGWHGQAEPRNEAELARVVPEKAHGQTSLPMAPEKQTALNSPAHGTVDGSE